MRSEKINRLLNECISVLREKGCIIQENRVVTFGNKVYPNNGWCVIMGGGSGSGKGNSLNFNVPINGKTINVDSWKKLVAKMNGIDYKSRNPEQVAYLHKLVKQKGYKDKYINNLFKQDAHQGKGALPNVIFDMTAKNPYDDVFDLAEEAQEVGYKTMLVWTVATRAEAILRNLKRERRVPDNILHTIHNALLENMPKFLQSSYASDCLDDAWIVFSSHTDLSQSDLSGEDKKTAAVQLQRTDNGFIIDDATMKRLMLYLGKAEATPDNPSTYLSSDEIIANYPHTLNKKGGYDFDRSKFDLNKGLYR